jgi:hypothetical protein
VSHIRLVPESEPYRVDVSLTNFNSIQPMWALFYYVEHRIDGWQEMAEELPQFVVSSSIYLFISAPN